MRVNEQAIEASQSWLAADAGSEVRKIVRQNELAFRLFVAGCITVCGLIVLAMFLG